MHRLTKRKADCTPEEWAAIKAYNAAARAKAKIDGRYGRDLNKNYAWKAANREKVLAHKRAYRQRNKAKIKAYEAKYRPRGLMRLPYQNPAFSNTVYAAAAAAVSTKFPRDVRDDIISSIVLAVLEGELALEALGASVQKYVGKFYTEFSKYTTVSISEPIPGMEGLTYMDVLTTDSLHAY